MRVQVINEAGEVLERQRLSQISFSNTINHKREQRILSSQTKIRNIQMKKSQEE